MAQQAWSFNNNTLYGIARSSTGVPQPAALVSLWYSAAESGTYTQQDNETSDNTGYWEFAITKTGWYTIKFYGKNFVESDWILKIFVQYDPGEAGVVPLEYNTAQPAISVYEKDVKTDVNNNEYSIAEINIANIIPDIGTLKTIEIYYKKSEDTNWKTLKTINVPDHDELENLLPLDVEMFLKSKPEYWDFKAIFLNGLGIPYKTLANMIYETSSLNVKFDGVPDLYEYVEGLGLGAINTDDPEGGAVVGNVIKFQWTDIKGLGDSAFPIESADAFGAQYTITKEIAKKLTSYVLYMYISDDGNPAPTFTPGLVAIYGGIPYSATEWGYKGEADVSTEGVGKWVFVGEYSTPYAEVTCPRGKGVQFWLGFKTEKTQTNIAAEKYVY